MRKTPYEILGGETTVKKIVERFYDIMDTLPEAKTIRDLHNKDLSLAREKLFMFMSGWLGGPHLYLEKYGHPKLRARHLPFSIGKTERDQWMICMTQAFEDVQIDEPIRSELLQSLLMLADHMRNRNETGEM